MSTQRYRFNITAADLIVYIAPDGLMRAAGTDPDDDKVTVTAWSAPTGGTRYTDLLGADGQPVTGVDVERGSAPFQGPPGVKVLYVSAGLGRVLVVSPDALTELLTVVVAQQALIAEQAADLAELAARVLDLEEAAGAGIVVGDEGSGFYSLTGAGVTDLGNGFYEITGPNVVDSGDGYPTIGAA